MRRTFLLLALLLVVLTAPTTTGGEKLFEKQDEPRWGEPTDDQALVYVVRPSKMGFAIKFWAFADDQVLGVTKGQSYLFGLVPEGKRLFWSKAENISPLEMEVVGGETYYLKQTVRMGGMKARVKLTPMSREEAEGAIGKCKYATVTDAGRKRGQEIVGTHLDRAREKEAGKEKYEEEEGNDED